MKTVRTRVAPSPTGFPHLGTIYQAMFDCTWARKNNGQFVFRLEDTDMTRFVEGAEDSLYKAMEWFGLTPDESPKLGGKFAPYRQSERLPIYKKYAEELVEKGHAYYCFCSTERLTQIREAQTKAGKVPMYDKQCRNLTLEESKKRVEAGEQYVIRMKMPENEKIIVKDLIRGDLEFDSNGVDDQVIIKSDGFPTYHLAVVVDDHEMEISHAVRGPEWIPSYPKHKMLYDYFGWEMPVFVHTPMITNMDGSKLSKRQGHASVDWYRRKGFMPEAVLNFISLLGWSHPDQKEIFTYSEFVEKFDLKDVSAVSPKFDLKKLEWMNGQYLQNLPNDILLSQVMDWLNYCITNPKFLGAAEYISEWNSEIYNYFLKFITDLDTEKRNLFAEVMKTRIKKYEDLLEVGKFFVVTSDVDIKTITKSRSAEEIKTHLSEVIQLLEKTEWNMSGLKEVESKLVAKASEKNWKVGEIFTPIRIAIARSTVTPPLFESMFILGKDKTLANINQVVDLL